MIFSAPDSYFKNDKHDVFMKFEETMSRTLPTNTSMVCWYLEKWINNLSLASIIQVLTNHKYTIYSGSKYKEWNKEEIINTIDRGIDNILGKDSSTLLFQSMKIRHKFNKDAIVSKPIVFEGILKGVVGEDSADLVINSIREQFINSILYTREAI